MGWFNQRKENEYVKRQIYILSNLGLFYLIIIALFGVPLVGTFVVVLIKGVIDLRFLIAPAAALLLCLMLFPAARGIWRLFQRFRRDGRNAVATARLQGRGRQAVQISLLNGLVSLTVSPQSSAGLPQKSYLNELPAASSHDSLPPEDQFQRLKELVALKEAGEINQHEFEIFKADLIDNTRRFKSGQDQDPISFFPAAPQDRQKEC